MASSCSIRRTWPTILAARRIQTQTRVLSRIATGTALVAGLAFILMTFPRARQIGASLLASAGVAGLIAGIAARSVFSNLLAGLQIALSQPIRIDDVLIVEGEWGRVEEITRTYVVLKIWDERRLVVPLGWFIDHPFQNWTRRSADILGTVFLWVDYTPARGCLAAGGAAPVRGVAELGPPRLRGAGHRRQRAGDAGAHPGQLAGVGARTSTCAAKCARA
jgi:hypothetical protein